MYKVAILTISDKGSRGEREDRSGDAIRSLLSGQGAEVTEYAVVPDDLPSIAEVLSKWADENRADVILTTGGTGLAPRDVTPEATLRVADRLVPGFAEAMRAESLKKTPHAVLSRAVAATRGRTLIINLPGSPRAVKECLAVILPALPHAVETLTGVAEECARPPSP